MDDRNLPFTNPSAIIRRRVSCRRYRAEPLTAEQARALEGFLASLPRGPFGSSARFRLAAAQADDRSALRGLGTYGFIHHAPAFVIAAARDAGSSLEDFGWQMEQLVLFATSLGLGTCWLGGSFTRSRFAEKIAAGVGEIIPAVIAVGTPAAAPGVIDEVVRWQARADSRLPWRELFFERDFTAPLEREQAGAFAEPLEMVRLAPSASNKQPWRAIRRDGRCHFYLRRTPGYREGLVVRLLSVADMQRIDMGIALCHFELAAREAGLNGAWVQADPHLSTPDGRLEYVASWDFLAV